MSHRVDTGEKALELERFSALLSERLGVNLMQEPRERLEHLLAERVARTHAPDEWTYLERLADPALGRDEVLALADALAVRESYFFRNAGMFQAIAEHVLPQLHATRAPGVPLRLLSAGCAAGEEPYSLAILVREISLTDVRPVEIDALDVSPRLVDEARRGVFSDWSFRELSAERRDRWFEQVGPRHWRIDPRLVRSVRFSVRNLLEPDPSFWKPHRFDLILCRNVLIYLTPSASTRVVDRLEHALAPGGFLFLGHAETLHGRGRGFRLHHSHGAFYYQRVPRGDAPVRTPGSFVPPPFVPKPREADFREADSSQTSLPQTYSPEPDSRDGSGPADREGRWARRIHDIAAHIESLLPSRRAGRKKETRPSRDDRVPAREPADDVEDAEDDSTNVLAAVLALAREERFGEASALAKAAEKSARTTDATRRQLRIARAALLLNAGDVDAAGRLCRQLLEEDEMDATVRYIDAVRRTTTGDEDGASKQLRAAAYLDPRFALPRLQLGILLQRRGDRERARRELEQAIRLLPDESPWRITLLGGGFDTEGLIRVGRRALEGE